MNNLKELKLTIKSAAITIFCFVFIIANFVVYNEGNKRINNEYFEISFFNGELNLRTGKTVWTFDNELEELKKIINQILKKPVVNFAPIANFLLAEEYLKEFLNLVKQ